MMRKTIASLSTLFASMSLMAQGVTTERQYLSGKGCDDMVEWDFMCTDGNNSGEWKKIGVPSCWELQGFGTYQYGMKFYGKAFPEGVADEKGHYKYEFELPADWKGKQIELVFEASMTDTDVLINGRKAGSKHQGGFYRFIYDVSDRVFFGPGKKNRLEVTVAKESQNAGVNLAERRADYWNFGGLWRPVFMQARPALNMKHLAIDAKHDGAFSTNFTLNMPVEGGKITTVILDKNGKKVAENVTPIRKGAGDGVIQFKVNNPLTWSAETPELYTAEFALSDADGKLLHKETKKFGFRTIEVRESDGLYINGKKINIRGVNRHSFRPESGRTLSRQKNLEDVELIKSMNMNAVRLSHYPADPEFYEICDSLGLYVMDELSGWHGKHETINGRKLVREMVERDVNHPSIIWWSNGNEKGWNDELNDEFHKYDPQKRPVLHPQGNFGGFETMHYRSYGESQNYMRLPEIFMPTEFLHGLYDGGHGAGLYDYWEMMRNNPKCAGGFLWVLADEGVKRVDMGGFIDNCGNYGADGIVGPHHEKEGSYWTIKEVWCPIQILNTSIPADFDGRLEVENRYDFTNLNGCTLKWRQLAMPAPGSKKDVEVVAQGTAKFADIAPRSAGSISIPTLKPAADALELTVVDNFGKDLFTWSHKIDKAKPNTAQASGSAPVVNETADRLTVSANGRTYLFSKTDGMLMGVDVKGRHIEFGNGPRVVVAKRSDRSMDGFYNHDDKEAEKKKTQYTEFEDLGKFVGISARKEGDNVVVTSDYRLGNFDSARWTIAPDGSAALDYTYNFDGVIDLLGVKFGFPEEKVISKRWVGDGPYRVWQNRIHGPQYGVWENDYNDPVPAESFTYPEFKGYFANVDWMDINTQDGTVRIINEQPAESYIGVYEPRDGRDHILYELPKTGISVMEVIPPVRNKVNTTDLIGPSSQPKWVNGKRSGRIILNFE